MPLTVDQIARTFVAVRGLSGAAVLVAPRRMTASWSGPAADLPGGQLAARSVGIREVALACGLLAAGEDREQQRPWLLAAAAADAVDVAATAWSLRRLRPRWGSIATIVLGSVACATQLRSARRGSSDRRLELRGLELPLSRRPAPSSLARHCFHSGPPR